VGTRPRSSDPVDYQASTSLEALMGYLYIEKNWERLERIRDLVVEGL